MPSLGRAWAQALVLAVLLAAWLSGAASAQVELVTVTFLRVNDVDELTARGGTGGIAAELVTRRKSERAAAQHAVTTSGGALSSPSLVSALVEGEQMTELARAIGIELAVSGNHESESGPEVVPDRTQVGLATRRGRLRIGERSFGNLLAHAMRLATLAPVAIPNRGGIRSDRTQVPPAEAAQT
jgi:2',3'-cyclic-nucleotide 2'-phosphodiesterase (5'-nucleotidase family)